MSTIIGTFVDSVTGKPVPGVTIDFYPDGNRSNDPYTTVTSGSDGSFTITSALLDTETAAVLDAYATGYNERVGPASAFSGTNMMTPVTEESTGVSWWIPILIVAAIVFVVWHFKLYKHL